MKNFKEFSAEWELADTFKDWKIGDCMFALYSAYQQGYNEGMKENLNNMLSAPITLPQIPLSRPAYLEELNAQYESDKKC